jgi:hypothetical protein
MSTADSQFRQSADPNRPQPAAPASGVDRRQLDDRSSGVAPRFPHAASDDRRLSAEALALLAFRSTFLESVRRFRTLPAAGKNSLGLGRDRFYATAHELKALGYVEREQSRPCVKTIETVHLDRAPAGRSGYQRIDRAIFEAGLSARAVGVLVWARSHSQSFKINAAAVMKRFAWSRPTALKYLGELLDAGLVGRRQVRGSGQRFETMLYVAPGCAPPDAKKPDAKKPDTDVPTSTTSQQEPRTYASARVEVTSRSRARPTSGRAHTRNFVFNTAVLDELAHLIAEADRSRVLHRRLLTRNGLQPLIEMIRRRGASAVLDVVRATLALPPLQPGSLRHMPVGAIKSWSYFAHRLFEDERLRAMELSGFRPGDAPGGAWREMVL